MERTFCRKWFAWDKTAETAPAASGPPMYLPHGWTHTCTRELDRPFLRVDPIMERNKERPPAESDIFEEQKEADDVCLHSSMNSSHIRSQTYRLADQVSRSPALATFHASSSPPSPKSPTPFCL